MPNQSVKDFSAQVLGNACQAIADDQGAKMDTFELPCGCTTFEVSDTDGVVIAVAQATCDAPPPETEYVAAA